MAHDPRDAVRGVRARPARARRRAGAGSSAQEEGRPAPSPTCLSNCPTVPAVQSSAFSPAARQNLTLHSSRDDGRTWQPVVSVYPGSAAYSSLVADGPSAVALAFERDNYGHISFAAGLSIP